MAALRSQNEAEDVVELVSIGRRFFGWVGVGHFLEFRPIDLLRVGLIAVIEYVTTRFSGHCLGGGRFDVGQDVGA